MTTRAALLLKFIDKNMKGIEIAPFHRPIAPKSQGFNCLSLDIFDTQALKERARKIKGARLDLISVLSSWHA
jgi:hypothetical protein